MKIKLTTILATIFFVTTNLVFSQISWQKHEGNPVLVPTAPWEQNYGVLGPRVLKVGNLYMMWYSALGSRRLICLATSEDGIHWTKSNANPVLTIGQPGDFDSEHVTYGFVMPHNDQLWMWYTGHNGQVWQIGLATSSDGVHWTKHAGNPVLRVGAPGEWDAAGVNGPFVIFDGQTFKMWFNGNGQYIQASGYAESIDGIHWQKHAGNPVLTPISSGWESRAIGMNTILWMNGLYHLWYGGDGGIATSFGYATSLDGIAWNRYEGNPIFRPGNPGAWDGTTVGGFIVSKEDDLFKMWYSGYSDAVGKWQIGYAESKPEAEPCSGIPLPAAEAYGNLPNRDQSHIDEVTYCFPGQTGDKYLSFEVYDIDQPDEVDLILNGTHILDIPVTANNGWSGLIGVLLSDAQMYNEQANELVFDNKKNPPNTWRWGVRRVSVDPFYALPSPAAYGRIPGGDQTHADKVVYFFSGQPGDLNLLYEAYDIDQPYEVDVLLNGAKIHDVAITANETWSAARSLLVPDERIYDNAINVLIFENTKNPPERWFWGVRNVSMAPAGGTSLTVNPTVTGINGSGAKDIHYLLDGRLTPPLRMQEDTGAPGDPAPYAIAGATTITPNGHATIEFSSAQRFDYLTLYPEWHPNRYFRYRVEVSAEGNTWRTVLDKSQTFVHGDQLVALPNTQARFLRLTGASCVINVDSLQALDLNEEAYWQAHESLLRQAVPQDLALAEIAFIQTRPTVGVKESASAPPTAYHLEQNVPNPFNPSTQIRFSVPRAGLVHLAVYNLHGELVRTLFAGELPAGNHAFTFEGSGLATGVYLYRVQTEGFTAVRKMLLAK